MKTDKIYQGNSLDVLKTFPDQSIDMAICSPPYWALRDYQSEDTVWDSNNECEHEWNEADKKIKYDGGFPRKEVAVSFESTSNFCSKCSAWKGQLGLEPNFDLYIKHLCDIFEETKRVLKDEGTLWVNLGDTYAGGGGNSSKYTCGPNGMDKREHARPEQSINNRFSKWNSDTNDSIQVSHDVPKDSMNVKNKSLIGIPFRFAIEMINRGWILRNTLIWHKNNVMPSSVKDRFTVDFEYLFFFSKQGKYYFEQQFEKSLDYKDDIRRMSRNRKHSKNSQQSQEQWNAEKINIDRIKKGRNKRAVWEINTKPYKEAHFAVFPEALIETPILAGCSPKGIVLDMFMGSGTTGLVALKNNRKYVGIELNEEYIGMAEKRLNPYKNQSLDGFQDQKK
jgi:site-specific DNA-methyltransferase (cytosine-N4-specific)